MRATAKFLKESCHVSRRCSYEKATTKPLRQKKKSTARKRYRPSMRVRTSPPESGIAQRGLPRDRAGIEEVKPMALWRIGCTRSAADAVSV